MLILIVIAVPNHLDELFMGLGKITPQNRPGLGKIDQKNIPSASPENCCSAAHERIVQLTRLVEYYI
jgi:hypothetical protein